MKPTIIEKLRALENEFQVKILFACESGSRAWGFASPDSDYDVRFIYAHTKEYYLSIEDQRDVIELPINDVLDINGWELRKALRLFRKSNAPIYEWLQSPVVYKADEAFVNEINALMSTYFSPRSAMHHYLSMAKGVFADELSRDQVRLKKYFYALRPILACRWIADRLEVPPMEFSKLRLLMNNELNNLAESLLEKKSKVDEKFTIAPIDQLNTFIKGQIDYCENVVPEPGNKTAENEKLNQLFRKYLL